MKIASWFLWTIIGWGVSTFAFAVVDEGVRSANDIAPKSSTIPFSQAFAETLPWTGIVSLLFLLGFCAEWMYKESKRRVEK